jgi:hypothetical protein
MELYFKLDEIAGQGRYIMIENEKFLDNIISCFSGTPRRIIESLRTLKTSSCYACLAIKVFSQAGMFYSILEVGILNPNRDSGNFKKNDSLDVEGIVYIHPNAEFNVMWDEILLVINRLTGEMDRISDIIQ